MLKWYNLSCEVVAFFALLKNSNIGKRNVFRVQMYMYCVHQMYNDTVNYKKYEAFNHYFLSSGP